MRDHEAGMSIRQASFIYNVKWSTLADACNRKLIRPAGRAKELSDTEEQAITDHLMCQSDWGFPLTREEVRMLVKDYLDRKNVVSNRFKDNAPGTKWMNGFLGRHPELQQLVPKLIKASRAQVDPATVNKYFDNLERTLEGVPAKNILNFDETNLSDDPANKHVIVRRGEKYPVKVMTTSKTAISFMFAGTASGTLLPPYVVFKSKEMSETWTADGPPGTRYNRSASGWFDMHIFEEWFSTILLSWAKTVDGQKVVIGDNVSSHFSRRVFELCAENNIKFVCLPPNSTHLLQPLDVAFFSPLKSEWKKF
ncbi:Pogo transposable element with KRAB domain [Frankliniella fusca]|uniref:Pogo transposable element with KRAB domain n=1 Tax=Frankliniella fusca TaxID=407009 RepID=A0AAE1LLI6_9NEOP|nr:Pogo transposable element with KRAB domain [Frankliniella fusca]